MVAQVTRDNRTAVSGAVRIEVRAAARRVDHKSLLVLKKTAAANAAW